jgi:hypothetical protein
MECIQTKLWRQEKACFLRIDLQTGEVLSARTHDGTLRCNSSTFTWSSTSLNATSVAMYTEQSARCELRFYLASLPATRLFTCTPYTFRIRYIVNLLKGTEVTQTQQSIELAATGIKKPWNQKEVVRVDWCIMGGRSKPCFLCGAVSGGRVDRPAWHLYNRTPHEYCRVSRSAETDVAIEGSAPHNSLETQRRHKSSHLCLRERMLGNILDVNNIQPDTGLTELYLKKFAKQYEHWSSVWRSRHTAILTLLRALFRSSCCKNVQYIFKQK